MRVTRSPPNCEGVEYTSGCSSTVSTFSASRAIGKRACELIVRATDCIIAYLHLPLYPGWRVGQHPRGSLHQ